MMRYQVLCQDCHFVYVKEIIDFTDVKYRRVAVDDFEIWKRGKLDISKPDKPEWIR